MTEPAANSAGFLAHHRRFRLGARTWFVVVMLFLLTVRLIWGYYASNRLARAVDSARADGTLFEPFEFSSPQVEPSANPVTYIRRACDAQAQNVESPRNSGLSYPEFPPYPAAWHELMNEAMSKNGECLRVLREARQYNKADWGVRPQFALPHDMRGHSSMRSLANLAADSALYHHLHGNDAEALACVRDVLHLADVVKQQGSLVAYLVGVGIDAVALSALQVVSVNAGLEPEARAQAAALMEELSWCDDAGHFQRSVQFERMLTYQLTCEKAREVWVMRPAIHLELARNLTFLNQLVGATLLPTYQQARAAIPTAPSRLPLTGWLGAGVQKDLGLGMSELGRVVNLHASELGHRRAVMAALAVHMYRWDHQGEWPTSLTDLVPSYLAQVPMDPFTVSPTPLQYGAFDPVVPLAPPRRVIFCAASDGVPATQPLVDISGGPATGYTMPSGAIVVDLTVWRQPAADVATTQPGEFVAPLGSSQTFDNLP